VKFTPLLAAAAVAAMAPVAADAAIMNYTIDGAGHHATFALRVNPTNFTFSDVGYDFGLDALTSVFDGVANVAGVSFYANPFADASPNPGGLNYLENTTFFQFNVAGPQLYSGSESTPTMLAFGPTLFTDLDSGAQITISAVESVPEPATWATMVIGFGLIGAAYRTRSQTAVAKAA